MLVSKFLLLFAHFTLQAYSSKLPPISSLTKEITINDSSYGLFYTTAKETGSYFYSICDPPQFGVGKVNCNVTVEIPVTSDVSYKETCTTDFVLEKPHWSRVSKIQLKPFDDERVLLLYHVNDQLDNFNRLAIRIVRISDCTYREIGFSNAPKFSVVATSGHVELLFSPDDAKLCGADSCRLVYDAEGRKIGGPSAYLRKISNLTGLVYLEPLLLGSADKVSYLQLVTRSNSRHGLSRVNQDGSLTELLAEKYDLAASTIGGTLGVCWAEDTINVTCRQYDDKANVKLEANLQFFGPPGNDMRDRWLKTHNLREGGLLVISGSVTGKDNPEFESFSLVKVQPNGYHGKQLEIRGPGFKCDGSFSNVKEHGFQKIMVNVVESVDEYCVQFICDQKEFDAQGDRSVLKFSTKCLSKNYL